MKGILLAVLVGSALWGITPEEVHSFWFEEKAGQWFVKDAALDAEIAERFGAWIDCAAEGGLEEWKETPQGWVALVVLLDQFPRNIYRNSPRAFAYDEAAKRVTLEAQERGVDRELSDKEREMLYMPLMHAEDLNLQELSVARFAELGGEPLRYAKMHRDLIARFGRFPYRNKVLGRASTPEEEASEIKF